MSFGSRNLSLILTNDACGLADDFDDDTLRKQAFYALN